MKILMQNRIDAFVNRGGDTIQMLKTKEQLEKLGVDVDISLELEPDLGQYDIVHLFNLSRVNETWMQYRNAKEQNKKIVISTIYHSKKEIRDYEDNALMGLAKIIKAFCRNEEFLENIKTLIRIINQKKGFKSFINQFKLGYTNQQRDIINGVDMILPNSEKEIKVLCNELGIKKDNINYTIIPNGVEIYEYEELNNKDEWSYKYPKNSYIFCAGRIEPLKNQIALINALKDINEKIIFAGKINKKHKKYYKKFIHEIKKNNNLSYVGLLDKEELNYAYKNAKVTVLPSWFETTGLTGIESISKGTPAIITNRGYTKEYYGEFVEYCDPSDVKSIKNAVSKSQEKSVNLEFINLIKEKFNWINAAKKTKESYNKIYGGET